MAVIGHWLAAFPVCVCVPSASATLLCKLTMLSDMLCGLFLLCKLEHASMYAWYQPRPYPATLEQIDRWRASGEWRSGGWAPDVAPGEDGFAGYGAMFPFYNDLPYSHSVELMAIIGLCLVAFMRLRYGISLGYALGIMFALVSHPLMDMFFHDGYLLMGNRAVTPVRQPVDASVHERVEELGHVQRQEVTRCCIHLWQTPWLWAPSFVLEVAMAYIGYQAWMSTREPVKGNDETQSSISFYQRQFWTLALTHNMASFYFAGPAMAFGFSRWAPSVQFFTPAAYWSYLIVALTLWSWTAALYPIYKIEMLTVAKDPAQAREAGQYIQAP